jgi:hypothetical protein
VLLHAFADVLRDPARAARGTSVASILAGAGTI